MPVSAKKLISTKDEKAVQEPQPGQVPSVKDERLSKAQKALLDVLRNPSVLGLDVTDICKLADISRQTYYSAFKDDVFRKMLEAQTQEVLTERELPVIHNVLAKAADPSIKSHHWALMALKMMGRLEEKSQKPAQINIVFNVQRPPKIVSEDDVIESCN